MAQTTAGTLISTQTIACPVVAKITLYTVISGSLTALAFVRSNEDCGGDLNDAFFKLPCVSRVLAETGSRRWRIVVTVRHNAGTSTRER